MVFFFFLIGAFYTLEDVICIMVWLSAKKNLCDAVHLHTENQRVSSRSDFEFLSS